ncbi:MAG: glutamine synthetase beta-grasp domain-containing protein, partial [Oscillospiraceae bacterium]|nr:glutamine synthetase beta-grasp domain-containing protein [Oscillospiraceae bacterium]
MQYTPQEVMQYILEEDVKFIRLAFCDVTGRPKNISIMPQELSRAFQYGIAIDASAISGFGDEVHSDLLLHPDPATITVLPWRPEHGRVVRMFCSITYPDGRPFELDTRNMLKRAIIEAAKAGYTFSFGAEMEFYLFKLDENGEPTNIPYDHAGYMDVAPDDRCE